MMKKTSLLDAFEVKSTKVETTPLNDYDVFKDKVLLDELRTKIIENLIDNDVPQDASLNEFINNEIDKAIEGYDLTNLERSHIYTLIDNEINGYGPLTELLKDKNITENSDYVLYDKIKYHGFGGIKNKSFYIYKSYYDCFFFHFS